MIQFIVVIELESGRKIELGEKDFPAKLRIKDKQTGEEIKRRSLDVRAGRKRRDVIVHLT